MNLKTNKGITLIALVITIIVLLILAGVTISMVLGDDGIITNATKAKEETEKMEYPERVRMAVASALVAGKGKVDTQVYTEEEIEEMLTESAEKQAKNNSIQFALEKEFGDEFGTDKKVTYEEEKITVGEDRVFKVDKKGTVAEENEEGDGSLSGGEMEEVPEPTTITFNYGTWDWSAPYTATAYEGMKWEEFVVSEFNPNDAFIISDSGYLYYQEDGGPHTTTKDGVSVDGFPIYEVPEGYTRTEEQEAALGSQEKGSSVIKAGSNYVYPYE